MGRNPCCSKEGMTKGAWTLLEDKILTDFIKKHGEGQWRSLPKKAGLKRCGKSCRLRWLNYLRPDIKRGNISSDEEELIIRLHNLLGNRWSLIAGRLPGRTDNEIKNYWNTTLGKRHLRQAGATNSQEHRPRSTAKSRRPSAAASRPRSLTLPPLPATQPSHVVVRAKAVRCTKAVAVAVSTRSVLHKTSNFNDKYATSEGLFNRRADPAEKPEAEEAPPFFGETDDQANAVVPFLEMDFIGSDPGDPIPLPDLLTDHYSNLSDLMGCDSEYFNNYCNVNSNNNINEGEDGNNADQYIQTTPSTSSTASTYSSDEPLLVFSQDLMEDWLGHCA